MASNQTQDKLGSQLKTIDDKLSQVWDEKQVTVRARKSQDEGIARERAELDLRTAEKRAEEDKLIAQLRTKRDEFMAHARAQEDKRMRQDRTSRDAKQNNLRRELMKEQFVRINLRIDYMTNINSDLKVSWTICTQKKKEAQLS
jgi:hypothetical protein